MHKLGDLITAREVADRLRVDRSVVTRWVHTGRIVPVHKLPGATGAYLFDPASLDLEEVKLCKN